MTEEQVKIYYDKAYALLDEIDRLSVEVRNVANKMEGAVGDAQIRIDKFKKEHGL